jgi:hypothetical protein
MRYRHYRRHSGVVKGGVLALADAGCGKSKEQLDVDEAARQKAIALAAAEQQRADRESRQAVLADAQKAFEARRAPAAIPPVSLHFFGPAAMGCPGNRLLPADSHGRLPRSKRSPLRHPRGQEFQPDRPEFRTALSGHEHGIDEERRELRRGSGTGKLSGSASVGIQMAHKLQQECAWHRFRSVRPMPGTNGPVARHAAGECAPPCPRWRIGVLTHVTAMADELGNTAGVGRIHARLFHDP